MSSCCVGSSWPVHCGTAQVHVLVSDDVFFRNICTCQAIDIVRVLQVEMVRGAGMLCAFANNIICIGCCDCVCLWMQAWCPHCQR